LPDQDFELTKKYMEQQHPPPLAYAKCVNVFYE